ncbi:MAG: SH3 domain-containing protein [Myxococcales bacterium]|nr:SH3 domain-containing protein [Myxococcales bacterium]
MRSLPSLAALLSLLLATASLHAADEDEDVDAFAKVVTAEAELRSGPGVSHRVIYVATRGETFLIEGRESSGYWLKVAMPDGRIAYVLGDTVEAVAAGPDAPEGSVKPGFFAPPALQTAHGGFAMMAGLFDHDGYVELRPAGVLAPAIAIEPYVGLALQKDSRRYVYGVGATLILMPDWPVAPFVHIGGGGMHEKPNDEFVRSEADFFHARAGGGFLLSLRWRILIRAEANNTILFTEDSYTNVQTYYGGLGTYF